jgi:hypothetical protein
MIPNAILLEFVVRTSQPLKSLCADMFHRFALDTPELVGGTAVWLASKEASFLSGRFVSVNWSVDELKARKEEITKSNDLKMVLQGLFGIES